MESEIELMTNYFKSKECEIALKKLNSINCRPKKKFHVCPINLMSDEIFKKHNQTDHADMWRVSVEKVVTSPPKSEQLAVAYADRSQVLYHFKKYKDAIVDINNALKITKSLCLKVQLYCYLVVNSKACCLGIERNAYEKACYWLKKINKDNKQKLKLTALVQKVGQFMNSYQRSDMEDLDERAELVCSNDGIKINYDKKFGRHLVAATDILPGELICVEKFFAAAYNAEHEFLFCSHCLSVSWRLIPCDYCSSSYYCSEKCKRNAWNKYHDIECSLLSDELICNTSGDGCTYLAIKLVIMAIKECGSIEKLRKELKSVDNCQDNWAKGMKGTKFCTFKSVYSLSDSCDFNKLDILISHSGIALISLVMHTKILGKKYTFNNNNDLLKNKNIVFIGALILKFSKIAAINSKVYFKPHLETLPSFQKKNYLNIVRGRVIAPLCSLINHSCNPNVQKVFMDNGKICYFSILPIKENEQIFECYETSFQCVPKSDRRKYLSDTYNFRCYCEACTNNWSSDFMNPAEIRFHYMLNFSLHLKDKFDRKKELRINLLKYFNALMEADLETNIEVTDLIGRDIMHCIDYLKNPCSELFLFINLLSLTFERVYGSVQIALPDKCQDAFKIK